MVANLGNNLATTRQEQKIIYYRSQDEMMAYRALISVCPDCTVKGADYCSIYLVDKLFNDWYPGARALRCYLGAGAEEWESALLYWFNARYDGSG